MLKDYEEIIMISCWSGCVTVTFPAEWLKGFDMEPGFAGEKGRAQICFPAVGKAFEIWIEQGKTAVTPFYRELLPEESKNIAWGTYCFPWKSDDIYGAHRPIYIDLE